MSDETIKGFTITNHFLKFEEGTWDDNDEYRIPWNEPNVKWKIRKVQGDRQLITNIQYDGSEHSPDLFLYTNVKHHESTNAYELAEDNCVTLNVNRKWYVKQLIKKKDRTGIRQFTTLPLGVFREYWRKPILPRNMEIGFVGRGLSTASITLLTSGLPHTKFRSYLDFPELDRANHNRTVEWLKDNCHDGIYLFSDYESMFVDPDDEFAFIASCMRRDER